MSAIDAASVSRPWDLLIVGGGIVGTGIARYAAQVGLRPMLVERDDLASGGSSASSKLILGSFAHLRLSELRRLRDILLEGDHLVKGTPHLVSPLRFVVPNNPLVRPGWMIRLALALQDRLVPSRPMPGSKTVELGRHAFGASLRDAFKTGYAFSDWRIDDCRLVVSNARQASDKGAIIATRSEFVSAVRHGDHWRATVRSSLSGKETVVTCRAIVNAAGAHVGGVLGRAGLDPHLPVRLVRTTQIVLPQLVQGDHGFVLQQDEGRLVFVLPYEGDFTLVGGARRDHAGDPDDSVSVNGEVAYLCDSLRRYFSQPIEEAEIVCRFTGVRPLPGSGADGPGPDFGFRAILDGDAGRPPILSVFGGTIAMYRRMAQDAVEQLRPFVGPLRDESAPGGPLLGGDFPDGDFDAFLATIRQRYGWLSAGQARRYARAYGTRITELLGDAGGIGELGRDFGEGLFEAEVRHLMNREWAITADDVLWRRSKLGLRATPSMVEQLAEWMADFEHKPSPRAAGP